MTGDAASEPSPVYQVRVADMAEDDRPRERLQRLGSSALKSEELLAILLRTGTSQEDVLHVAARLLHERGGLFDGNEMPGGVDGHGDGITRGLCHSLMVGGSGDAVIGAPDTENRHEQQIGRAHV